MTQRQYYNIYYDQDHPQSLIYYYYYLYISHISQFYFDPTFFSVHLCSLYRKQESIATEEGRPSM